MRPRKSNQHLPKYVYLHHGAYYLVRQGKRTFLGRDLGTALHEYAARMPAQAGSLDKLIDDALASMEKRLSDNTMDQYRGAAHKLKHMLGEFTPQQLLPRHVAQLKMTLADTPNMANRCLTVLRVVFNYALEHQLVDSNPAIGIRPHHEPKRRRLIAPAEYQRIYEVAKPRMRVIMDLLYLTGQRVDDVLTIRLSDLREEGIYFEQDKTEARLIVGWTPELTEAIACAKALPRRTSSLLLFTGIDGGRLKYTAVYSDWCATCKLAGIADTDMRDIRAMAATAIRAQGGNATALLGHTNQGMTERYLRDKVVPTVNGPSFTQVVSILPTGTKKAS